MNWRKAWLNEAIFSIDPDAGRHAGIGRPHGVGARKCVAGCAGALDRGGKRVLGVKPQTLKSRLHRGRLILREQLADFADGLAMRSVA